MRFSDEWQEPTHPLFKYGLFLALSGLVLYLLDQLVLGGGEGHWADPSVVGTLAKWMGLVGAVLAVVGLLVSGLGAEWRRVRERRGLR